LDKSHEKRVHGRLRSRHEDHIKIIFRKIDCDNVNWTDTAQDKSPMVGSSADSGKSLELLTTAKLFK
jgi:hypothetical protein